MSTPCFFSHEVKDTPSMPFDQVSKNGSRMILKDLDPDAVERWVDMKKASVAAKIIRWPVVLISQCACLCG
jgi:hypothetical protein